MLAIVSTCDRGCRRVSATSLQVRRGVSDTGSSRRRAAGRHRQADPTDGTSSPTGPVRSPTVDWGRGGGGVGRWPDAIVSLAMVDGRTHQGRYQVPHQRPARQTAVVLFRPHETLTKLFCSGNCSDWFWRTITPCWRLRRRRFTAAIDMPGRGCTQACMVILTFGVLKGEVSGRELSPSQKILEFFRPEMVYFRCTFYV